MWFVWDSYCTWYIWCSSVGLNDLYAPAFQFGGIYGPALQDLREHLEENPDHAVAPEWSETVRNSVSVSFISSVVILINPGCTALDQS